MRMWFLAAMLGAVLCIGNVSASAADVQEMQIGPGWAKSSVNTVIFRHSSIVTFRDSQYTAYYDNDAHVVLARRTIGQTKWETRTTDLTGNAKDAHNTISLGIDGEGIVHMAWDHHGNDLNYVRTKASGTLELTDRQKTDGLRENAVTYPEFYSLPNGDMLLLYRVGRSGNGDLVLKRYTVASHAWSTVQQNLVSGEDKQNAYPEFCVGPDGTFHLGWVWRGSPDVATNHNICYAKSTDGGATWTNAAGKKVGLPITADTGEIALAIPQNSELINQTTIAGDAKGHPYIATYFRKQNETVPQYHIVYHDGAAWRDVQVSDRKIPFSLSGGGTKRIPISRPLVLAAINGDSTRLLLIYRDIERGDKATLASTMDLASGKWNTLDLTQEGVGSWEPSADLSRWTRDQVLDLFVQKTDQLDGADGATRTGVDATPVRVLEYTPAK